MTESNEENELWTRYLKYRNDGDHINERNARDELVCFYVLPKNSLVHRIAWRLIHYLGLNSELLEDAIQESLYYQGKITGGLVFAIENYDPDRGTFSAYASKYIWYAMLHGETARNGLKSYQNKLIKKYKRIYKDYEEKFNRFPSDVQLSEYSGIGINKLKTMRSANQTLQPESINDYHEGLEHESEIERDLKDLDIPDFEEDLIDEELIQTVRDFLDGMEHPEDEGKLSDSNKIIKEAKLNQNECSVLFLRYVKDWSDQQISSQLELSLINIRVLHLRAVNKLNKYLSM